MLNAARAGQRRAANGCTGKPGETGDAPTPFAAPRCGWENESRLVPTKKVGKADWRRPKVEGGAGSNLLNRWTPDRGGGPPMVWLDATGPRPPCLSNEAGPQVTSSMVQAAVVLDGIRTSC